MHEGSFFLLILFSSSTYKNLSIRKLLSPKDIYIYIYRTHGICIWFDVNAVEMMWKQSLLTLVALISNVGHDDPFNGIRSIPDSTRWKMKHSRKSVVLSSFSRAYVVKINRNTRVTIPSNFEETGNIGPKASNENSKRICIWFSARFWNSWNAADRVCATRETAPSRVTDDSSHGLLRTVRSPFRQRSPNR